MRFNMASSPALKRGSGQCPTDRGFSVGNSPKCGGFFQLPRVMTGGYPLVTCYIAIENGHRNSEVAMNKKVDFP